MPIGLTRPRCGSCNYLGATARRSCRSRSSPRRGQPSRADGSPLLAALAADPSAEVLALAPLSERAVAELVRLGLGAEVEPAFARACHEVTGGVPFLVQELVRAIAEEGIEPTSAAFPASRALAPRAVSQSVVLRLRRLSTAARELARAAAVLGEADLRLAAGLAGVDPGAAATAADELADAGILEEGRPLRFVHPIVRAAVEADLSPGERAGLHAAAAGRLAHEGASAAPHRGPPAGDRPGRGRLGRRVTSCGRQDRDRERRSGLGRRLPAAGAGGAARPSGCAPTSCSSSASPSPTLETRRRRLISRRRSRPQPTRPLRSRSRSRWDACSRSRGATARRWRCSTARAPASAAPTGARRSRSRAPRSARPSSTQRPRTMPHRGSPVSAGWPRNSPTFPRACSARWRSRPRTANEPAETVARLALRALEGAPKLLPEAVDRPPFFYHACNALAFAERYEEALSRFDEAMADARRLGSLPHVLGLSCYRALAHLRIGNLADAEADARVALETGPRPPGIHAAVALAALLETLAERGEFEAAEAADQRYRLAEQFPTTMQAGWLLAARGRLRLAELRPAAALEDLLAAGDLFAPPAKPEPVDRAVALRRRPRATRARRTGRSESARGRGGRARRGLRRPARARGRAARGRPHRGRKARHRAAAPGGSACSKGSAARLEHARAMADLGAALRRAGQRVDSREILRPALDLAHRCGALALTERTRTELIAAGGRPRRLVLSGLDSLTPSERRVAQLAAAGLPNREIAQHLFITARTVEGHLTHAYQKLDITSREQLPAALANPNRRDHCLRRDTWLIVVDRSRCRSNCASVRPRLEDIRSPLSCRRTTPALVPWELATRGKHGAWLRSVRASQRGR